MNRQDRSRERESATANRAIEATSLGTAAASMILGATLPHSSRAEDAIAQQRADGVVAHHHDGDIPLAKTPYDTAIADAAAVHQPSTGLSSDPSMPPPANAARSDAATSAYTPSDPVADGASGVGYTDSTSIMPDYPIGSSGGASEPVTQSSPMMAGATGALDSIAGTLSDLGGAIDGALSSITQSLTDTVGNLSAMVSDLTYSLGNPLGLLSDNPVEALLHDAASSQQDISLIHPVGISDLAPASSSALAQLASLPGNVLGTPDGGMEQTFGAPETLYGAHPSLGSFGEIPVNIGFVGQALMPTADPHDLGSHGSGSLLHGFL